MGQMSAHLNQHQMRRLSSNTIANTMNEGTQCSAILTRSGKKVGGDESIDTQVTSSPKEQVVPKGDDVALELNQDPPSIVDKVPKVVPSGCVTKPVVNEFGPSCSQSPMPKVNPTFPQRLKKKKDDEKFQKFLSVFKTLSLNLPLLEALL